MSPGSPALGMEAKKLMMPSVPMPRMLNTHNLMAEVRLGKNPTLASVPTEKQKEMLIIPFASAGSPQRLHIQQTEQRIHKPPDMAVNPSALKFHTRVFRFFPTEAWKKPVYTWFELTVGQTVSS